jgi:asparagine synthetase B (glutamine-hydrolysing)
MVDLEVGTLELRDSVALRRHAIPFGFACYLSLYDDEIDRRSESFWAHATRPATEAAQHLEMTDAVFVIQADGHVTVMRGGACTFPLYFCSDRTGLRFSTHLPLDRDPIFSRSGMIAAAAAACQHSSYEPNAFTETPLARWKRLRRAAISCFSAGAFDHDAVIARPMTSAMATPSDRDRIAEEVRAAFLAYGRSQVTVQRSVLEVSGGFDSTLAATTLERTQTIHGISSVYPYYEFRSEVETQKRVAEALGLPRTVLDGTTLFPYAPTDRRVRWDEPSVFVTGARHAEQVATFAAANKAQRIYMGHGGDQCFATDLCTTEGLVNNPPGRGPFSAAAWRSLSDAMMQTRRSAWLHRGTGTFLYDARQDVWVKERFGATIRTPFTDLRIFRSAQLWSQWSRGHAVKPDKSILVNALRDRLPEAILEREGKAAYDGVWMRAYARHADHIAGAFDRAAATLEHLGVSASWLIRRVRLLGAWKAVSDREVLALYALVFWLLAWGWERPGDMRWA